MADAICRRSNERSGLARPATSGRLATRRFLGHGLQRNPCNGAGTESVAFVLRNLPASIAGLSTLAVPVCGVLFSWWLLHENPGKGGRLWHCVDSTGVGDDQYQETRGIACSGLQRCIKNTRLMPGVLLWFIPIPAGSADHTGRPPAARRRPGRNQRRPAYCEWFRLQRRRLPPPDAFWSGYHL